jgi:predicted HNH restriction endonuclease
MKQANRLEMYLILGAVCSRCGFSDNRVLSIHHKEGGGNIERDQYSQNSTRFLKVIKSNKDKYELLCANCHLIIERELYASS